MGRAAQIDGFGGPVTVREVDAPAPGAGELLVEARAWGAGPWDPALVAGYLGPQEFPVTVGAELAGVVRAVGAGVTGFAPGDRVLAYPALTGAWREEVVVPASAAGHVPDGLDLDVAAALPVCASTAWQALDLLGLSAGSSLLVLGAGGAVGGLVVQLAAGRGLTVLGTAAARDHARLTALGATALADYRGDWPSALGPVQVDGVLDLVGRDELRRGYALSSPTATLVTAIPGLDDEQPGAGRTLTFLGSHGDTAVLDAVAALAAKGELVIDVAARYPLADAAGALAGVAAPHGPGKVVLVP